MRNLLKAGLVSLIVLFLSCEGKDVMEPLGKCSNPPKLSSEKLIFDKKGGTQEVNISESYRFSFNYNGKEINSENLKVIKNEDFNTYKHSDFTIKTYKRKVIVTMNENKSLKRELYVQIASGNCFTGFTVEQK